MEHWSNNMPSYPQDDLLFSQPQQPNPSMSTNSIVSSVVAPSSLYPEDTLQQLKHGFSKMMMTMERLEQRLTRLEQTTTSILKNQQETLQVPFMSQTDIDRARQAAEQLEQDTSVAKQLQAAYNKEVELRKNKSSSHQSMSMQLSECPICGTRVSQMDLEVHVDQCLEMFSNDPKKEAQVQDTKKKIESGFFSKLFKKTETTKVVTTQSATAPMHHDMRNDGQQEGMIPGPNFYPPFAYPPPFNHQMQAPNGHGMPMMMPMYMHPSMYPQYPQSHMTTSLQE